MSIKVFNLMAILIGLVFFVSDRLIKYVFYYAALPDQCGFFHYTQNTGAGFGISLPKIPLIIFNALILFIVLVWLIDNLDKKNRSITAALWLIVFGASSNLLDRIKFGFVIDYIDLKIWPVFNFADIMIVVGIIILIVGVFHGRQRS